MSEQKKIGLILCHNFGDNPACLEFADERFTMRFDEIGELPLYWCVACGTEAKEMSDALNAALTTRGPEFVKEFADSIDKAETEIKRSLQ